MPKEILQEQMAVDWLIDELEKHEKGISEYFSLTAIKNHARRMEEQRGNTCKHNYILTSEQGHRIIQCLKCNNTQPI